MESATTTKPQKQSWAKTREILGHIRLSGRLLRDSRVPKRLKIYCLLAVLYLVSPLDLIPFWLVPFLGGLDDLGILWLALRTLRTGSPDQVVREHAQALGLDYKSLIDEDSQ